MSLADRWHSAILKNSLDIMRYDAQLRTEILAMLTELGRDLVKDLAGAGLNTPRTDWQRARLRALLEATQSRIGDTYTAIADHHALNLADAAEASANSLIVALNKEVGVKLLKGLQWTPEQLAALVDGALVEGAPSAAWWLRQGEDLQNAFADQMRQGMLRGETINQLRDRILGQDLPGVGAVGKVDLRTVADPAQRGLIKIARRNAEALVRTSAMSVNNAAQLAAYNANSDIIDKLQWTATLDPRTCLRCGAEDGKMWPLEEPHAVPPLHWNCRCVCVPITKTWEQLATKNKGLAVELDKIPAGTRASMGGPVSGDTTWESWLKDLPADEQTDILGPARQKLWDAGKLSISDLVDQQGNALTLAELKRR